MLFLQAANGCNIIAKNPVDGFGRHTYMAPHSGGRGLIVRSAFVSCLFLVGTADARNQSNRERKHVGSLTLLV